MFSVLYAVPITFIHNNSKVKIVDIPTKKSPKNSYKTSVLIFYI